MCTKKIVVVSLSVLACAAGTARAQWTTAGSTIYYNAGRVGVGIASPTGFFHAVGSTGLGTVRAENDGNGPALCGWSRGTTGFTQGVWAQAHSTGSYAVMGWATNSSGLTVGVYGQSDSPTGYAGLFKGGQFGVYGWPTASTGSTVGVWGQVSSASGWGGVFKGGKYGVWGEVSDSNSYSGYFLGGMMYTNGSFGIGTLSPTSPLTVFASTGSAIYSRITNGTAIQAETTGTNSVAVRGNGLATSGSNAGVQGTTDSTNGVGVQGIATTSTGPTTGVLGQSASSGGIGVAGEASSSTGACIGVSGRTDGGNDAAGVFGAAFGSSGADYGVWGVSFSPSGTGVRGEASGGSSSNAVVGVHSGTAGAAVYGEFNGTPSAGSYGVLGVETSGTGFAVYADGRFGASGTKNFQIDYPLDPANKVLNHFSVESPEPYLIYRGNAVLDDRGEAVVDLPEYFEAVNRDFQYQLTPIGAPALVYIASEVENNHFRIAGGHPGMKVSWTVTGVRNDRFVQAHPMADVEVKPAALRGRYISPELYGMPAQAGYHAAPQAILPEFAKLSASRVGAPAVRGPIPGKTAQPAAKAATPEPMIPPSAQQIMPMPSGAGN